MPTSPKGPNRRASRSPSVKASVAASAIPEPVEEKSPAKSRNSTAHKKRQDTCFVISPFGGWHDDYHREIFCAAIKEAGLEPTRADDLFRSSNIVHDIWHSVSSSRVMLADLTGKNPNVFYELGLAHAARKPVLLVTQTMDDVPFDLRALRVIQYDVQHPSWGELLRENIKTGLRETLKAPEGSVLPTFLLESPTGQTKVSRDEKRFLDLQQQMESLRTEVRALGRARPKSNRPAIQVDDATGMIRRLLERGAPDEYILDRLTTLGMPASWIHREIDDARGLGGSRRVTA